MKPIMFLSLLLLTACVSLPEQVEPVGDFDIERYLGRWYEIARLDHSFERGLSQVTAEYSLRSDGGVKVLNRGYSVEKNAWKEAEGKAYFVGEPDQAYLKVSFFGPFYGAYAVVALDHEQYQYALVAGPDTSYLWLLARNPELDAATRAKLVKKAAALGFDTGKLIYVDHSARP